jgi:hypothetical protein
MIATMQAGHLHATRAVPLLLLQLRCVGLECTDLREQRRDNVRGAMEIRVKSAIHTTRSVLSVSLHYMKDHLVVDVDRAVGASRCT